MITTTKNDLKALILRKFGYPMVKVELTPEHLNDAINKARNEWIKWGVGNSTIETWFTMPLSAGQREYEMPDGCVSVVGYQDAGMTTAGGINTLFTIENFLFMQGYYQGLLMGGNSYHLLSYHIARDFLETVSRYNVSMYHYKYHKYKNILEIAPTPKCGNIVPYYPAKAKCSDPDPEPIMIDSPGFILLHGYFITGSTLSDWNKDIYVGYEDEPATLDLNAGIWDEPIILDLAAAYAKQMLGMIRRKYGNNQAMGNIPIALDGDSLVQEAEREIEILEARLRNEEPAEGYGFIIG